MMTFTSENPGNVKKTEQNTLFASHFFVYANLTFCVVLMSR